ncbi:uncharacterized protein HMPREF1541_07220 [Cyphellophora europaea CBS 101466]|uniref:ABC transporter domain-containing protein n=1 Tax=Cyphellophora europaea (strain CBS 101466) TaxID=1220924 RepID=W2RPG4_CYPE1|nr:uncharacterized protein HMPREF1541_07220 [Cyphellophora europaea CBS 101466]ETN37598.1 hypothetical protein HMPREF1541_07220 [Cyphellophora europaea CBS 101466]
MDYPKTFASGAVLVYYLMSSLIASVRLPATPAKASPNQQRFQLATTSIVLVISIALSSVEGVNVGTIGRHGDDGLLSDLLFSLQWLVLLLAHIDHPGSVRYPHYGAWAISALSRTSALLNRMPARELLSRPIGRGIAVLLLCQIAAAVCLLVVVPILQSCAQRSSQANDESETQPLLGSEAASDGTKSDQEERNPRETPEQKKAREEIHKRQVREYLRSFLVYVPLLWPHTFMQKMYLGGMFCCMLSLRFVNVLLPLALGLIIDTLARGGSPWLPIAGYFTLYFVQSRTGIGLLEDFLRLMFTNQQKLTLSRAAYNHIMDLSADFQDAKTSSEIWQSMSQAQSVIDLFHGATFEVVPMLIDLVAGSVLLWAIFGPYMGFLVLTLMVMMIWVSVRAVKSRVGLSRKWRDTWYDQYHQMVDSTENWYTVAQFGQIPREKTAYQNKQIAALEGRNKLYFWLYRNGVSRFSIMTLAYLLAAALAALEIHNGELKVGAFATLTGYWAQVASPVMYIVHEITDVADKLVDAEKLLVLLEKKPTIKDEPDAKAYDYRGGSVRFEDVFFTYDGNKQAAKGVSFHAAPGKMTALVGETGGGKSTMLKLLMRFYDPEKGQVFLDDQDIRSLQLASFRHHIGVVPQEPSMFHTTILDNVRYPDPSLSEEEVQEACKAVSLHDKIMTFAKGYQTKVGERGCQLSGGEKQRLAIARAILKKPSILLLDEATSSVDSVTEGLIQASLDQVCKDRTTFVIAHRLSTILKADKILVIEGGKLVESGTHNELIKKRGGVYQKLWKSQLKLQGEKSRSRSRSRGCEEEQPLALVDDMDGDGDVASLIDGSDTPAEESAAQTPVEGSESPRGGAQGPVRGLAAGVGKQASEAIRSRFATSQSPVREDGQALNGQSTVVAEHNEAPSTQNVKSNTSEPQTAGRDQQQNGTADG